MSLYSNLQKTKSEEDVKDVYIKALGLKGFSKNLIDIQTKEVWFEAKANAGWSFYEMFTQLLHYIQVALNKGEDVPTLLCVVDTEKAAIMQTDHVLPFLAKKTIKWGKSASEVPKTAVDAISAHIGTHFVAFKIENDESEFVATLKDAIKTGKIVRNQITPDNIKQVFDKWVDMIGCEVEGVGPEEYNLLFFADIMHDGKVSTHDNLPAELLFRNGNPVFLRSGKLHQLASHDGYRKFWTHWDRPPKDEYRNYILERRDSLIPVDERIFRGSFYTPLQVVDKAYDLLTFTLGKNWQRRFKVWDMCCGVGNLEVKHSNPRNIFMSTLSDVDVDIMAATKTCVAAERFQYDYLNDDVTELGTIDYSLSNKIPQALRDSIAAGERVVVLINPPYAEAMNAGDGVAETAVGRTMGNDIGYANRELFVQFLMRIQREMPNAIVAMFSKLKYVNAPNFSKFREAWFPKYLGGFVVPSQSFDGLTGEFPIGFLIWDTAKKRKGILEIETEVLDRNVQPIGAKRFYDVPQSDLINAWIKRTKPNATPALPLVGTFDPKPGSTDVRGKWWAEGALGGMICKGSDFQNSRTVGLMSSGYASAGGILVTKTNLRECAIVFTARRLVKQTWLNDRDQFLAPTGLIDDEFANDCLVWMLFNTSNYTVSADGIEWNGKTWSLDNNFLPYTENEVGADGRFKSDFMSTHLATLKLSKEAKAVLLAGKKVWKAYFERKDEKAIRDRFHLGRPDVGWLQVRNVITARITSGTPVSAKPKDIEPSYKALGEKILPEIYTEGLLKG